MLWELVRLLAASEPSTPQASEMERLLVNEMLSCAVRLADTAAQNGWRSAVVGTTGCAPREQAVPPGGKSQGPCVQPLGPGPVPSGQSCGSRAQSSCGSRRPGPSAWVADERVDPEPRSQLRPHTRPATLPCARAPPCPLVLTGGGRNSPARLGVLSHPRPGNP